MPKNSYHEDWGIGEWGGNNPQADVDPVTMTQLGPRFPINKDSSDFNVNKVLLGNIQRNNYFKQLAKFTTFREVVDQIYYHVEFITPWEPGSHSNKSAGGMCSQVRGVATAGRPTKCWMWLVKLMTLRPTPRQIQILIEHPDSPYLRGIGFLFLRYCCAPSTLWEWVSPYLREEQPIKVQKFGHGTWGGDPRGWEGEPPQTTVGQFLRTILVEINFESTYFPRIPIPIHKKMIAEIEAIGLPTLSPGAQESRNYRSGGGNREDRDRDDRRGRDDRPSGRDERGKDRSDGHDHRDDERSRDTSSRRSRERRTDGEGTGRAAAHEERGRDKSVRKGRDDRSHSRSRSRGRRSRGDRDRSRKRRSDGDRDRDRKSRHGSRDRKKDRHRRRRSKSKSRARSS